MHFGRRCRGVQCHRAHFHRDHFDRDHRRHAHVQRDHLDHDHRPPRLHPARGLRPAFQPSLRPKSSLSGSLARRAGVSTRNLDFADFCDVQQSDDDRGQNNPVLKDQDRLNRTETPPAQTPPPPCPRHPLQACRKATRRCLGGGTGVRWDPSAVWISAGAAQPRPPRAIFSRLESFPSREHIKLTP